MKLLKLCILFCLVTGFSSKLFSQKDIKVTTKRNPDKSVSFYYEKNAPGSYFLILEFSNLENAIKSTFRKVLKYKSGELFKLKPINKDEGISFSYKYKYSIGRPNPKIDSLFQYVFPFKTGSQVGAVINNKFYGEEFLDSDKSPSWYSLNFLSKSSDTVLCMRKGVVVKIIDKYANSTTGKKATTKSNAITIEHKDGTIANYFGFNKDKILVKLGQTVYPHTQLGVINKNSKSGYSFSFRQYYISDNKTLYKEDRKLKDFAKGKKFIIPYFYTSKGLTKLESKKIYTVEFNDEIFFKEFSRREKKKYLKSLKKK